MPIQERNKQGRREGGSIRWILWRPPDNTAD